MVRSIDYEDAIALPRFGLGADAKGLESLVHLDARELLHEEVRRGPLAIVGQPSTAELLHELAAYNRARPPRGTRADDERYKAIGPNPALVHFNAEVAARYSVTCVEPAIGFNERMVMFWTNHFAVSVAKSKTMKLLSGAFEREAVRPNAFGRFTDLVMAVETHPAMLSYLDNVKSIGPDSAANVKHKHGLNENLAREVMELHILGVRSGYSQADVTALAKALTGWTIYMPEDLNDLDYGNFSFSAEEHEPGGQSILGRAYAADGFFQASDILIDLCGRPETAQHIAFKLARHFVSDTPPQNLVDRLANVFMSTDGDLAEVSHALVDADEAWQPTASKFRSPQEYLVAIIRAMGSSLSALRILDLLNIMGQPQWNPPGPNGYPDEATYWATPQGLSSRLDVAVRLAASAPPDTVPHMFAERILGWRLSDITRTAMAHAETMRQSIALLFLSPEFLRR